MSLEVIFLLGLIAVAIILFITNWFSIDLVSLGIMLVLVVSGIITVEEGLSGFSNSATITVAFMFVLSGVLLKTGAMQYVAYGLMPVFQKNPKRGLLLMMALVAALSAFVNNTPIVAVFIPVILQVSNSSGISPTKLLIPLSFASIMGGMCTVFGTSTNLLVSGIAVNAGINEIGVFTMTGPATILLIIGVIYIVFIGFPLLPNRSSNFQLNTEGSERNYLIEIEIPPNSELAGIRIMDSKFVRQQKLDILEIRRGDLSFNLPAGDFEIQSADILRMYCNVKEVANLSTKFNISTQTDLRQDKDSKNDGEIKLVELAITSDSPIAGRTLKDADFRRRYRAAPLAIRHRDHMYQDDLYGTKVKSGDIILAQVKSHYIKTLQNLQNKQGSPFVLISESPILDFDKKGFFIIVGIMLLMLLSASLGFVNIVTAVIGAVVALALLGKLNMKTAYTYINWKIVFVMAGVLSIATAMVNTGLDIEIANLFSGGLGNNHPYFILAILYLITALLTEIISNTATAAIMTPVAIGIAASFGLNPMPLIIGVMFASSASFMTPIGYQTNTMVYDAGNYKFTDFTKVGILLNLLFWLASTVLIPLFFPFN